MLFSPFLPEYSQPLYRPPSEAHSLIFQITEGCSYNGCTFCGMYVTKKFRIRSVEEIKQEIDRMPSEFRQQVLKIFLADGDAAIYPFAELIEILQYLQQKFSSLRRISAYAGPHAIQSKTPEEWNRLAQAGLKLLYFGLESGNDHVLTLMKKDMVAAEMAEKALMLKQAGIKLSIMVILGGGGKIHSQEHALDSAKWISKVNPEFFSLLTLFIRRKKNYFEKIETPTIGDLIQEARLLIENIEGKNIIFRSNHISNFVSLSGNLSRDKDRLLQQIDGSIAQLENAGQMNAFPNYYQESY